MSTIVHISTAYGAITQERLLGSGAIVGRDREILTVFAPSCHFSGKCLVLQQFIGRDGSTQTRSRAIRASARTFSSKLEESAPDS